ncbi:hypothetical protein [Niabella hibiscisoli]|uniref:hypothetical protein n=1 Tax=Niabella hibiscisoli TaxID=1825928 RepID=UPI001F0FDE57|nr:hypothetical protein [Niabella hibiscisoli]MCH5721381.1 hypothetical protein [Niabella hibiscisoli]
MNSISYLLYRSVVTPFYRQIAGAIYFLFFVLFGIQPNFKQALDTHYYIIKSIAYTPAAFSLFILMCSLYSIKCISFYASRSTKNEYQFLQLINSITFRKRLPHFVFTASALLLPSILYTLCIVVVCIAHQRWYALIAPVTFLVSLITLVTLSFVMLNRNPAIWKEIAFPKIINLPSRLWQFMLRYIFREQIFSLVILKLISFCCLYFFVITDPSVFESRMLWLIYTLCLAGHCVIIYKTFYFLENKLSFYRTLPMQPFRILAAFFLCYLVLLLPECWALRALAVQHHQEYEYSCMIIAGPAILCLLHVLLYTDDFKMDGYLSLVFLVWILFFFLSFSENKWLLPATAIAGVLIVFYTSFRSFEKKATVEKLE